jgi:hypothetical protein
MLVLMLVWFFMLAIVACQHKGFYLPTMILNQGGVGFRFLC